MSRANPFELLTAEHDLLRRNLGRAIELSRSRAESKESEASLRSFLAALRQHMRREEVTLYPLCERLFGGRESAMAVLRGDHAAIDRAAASLSPRSGKDGTPVAVRLTDLARILDSHLAREERVLFPLVATRLTEADSTFLVRELRGVGRK